MNYFYRQILAAIVCLVAMNVLVHRQAQNSIGRRHARMIRSAPSCTDLFFGHSLVAGGINSEVYDSIKRGRKTLNIGLNSTRPVEHFLILEQASEQFPARLYYGFLNDQLTHNPELDPLSDLIGNRSLTFLSDYYDSEAGARMYAQTELLKYYGLLFYSRVPILREQGTLWQKVDYWRRQLQAIGMPIDRRNRFGRAEDMADLGGSQEVVLAAIRQAVKTQGPLNSPVLEMLEWARRRDAAFYLILMPATSTHRAKHYKSLDWNDYKHLISTLILNSNGKLLDCSDWIDDDFFEDAIHLNPAGAIEFSTRLSRWVPD